MKRLVVASLGAAALVPLAAPAAAQAYHDVPYRDAPAREAVVAPGQDLGGQLDGLEARLQHGIAGGAIDRGEASRALNEITAIRRESENLRARHGGRLGEDDRLRLQGRLDHLSRSLRWMREKNARGLAPSGPGGWDRDRFWNGAPADAYDRIGWLRERLQQGVEDGSIDRRRAHRATEDLHAIDVMAHSLSTRDGGRLNGPDAAYLQSRLDELSRNLHWAERRGY